MSNLTSNFTIPEYLCTLTTCSISRGQLTYDPSLAGNSLFLSIFVALLIIHIPLGIYYRTWTYAFGTTFGFALEISGYVGRIKMHFNPFIQSPFFMYALHSSKQKENEK